MRFHYQSGWGRIFYACINQFFLYSDDPAFIEYIFHIRIIMILRIFFSLILCLLVITGNSLATSNSKGIKRFFCCMGSKPSRPDAEPLLDRPSSRIKAERAKKSYASLMEVLLDGESTCADAIAIGIYPINVDPETDHLVGDSEKLKAYEKELFEHIKIDHRDALVMEAQAKRLMAESLVKMEREPLRSKNRKNLAFLYTYLNSLIKKYNDYIEDLRLEEQRRIDFYS